MHQHHHQQESPAPHWQRTLLIAPVGDAAQRPAAGRLLRATLAARGYDCELHTVGGCVHNMILIAFPEVGWMSARQLAGTPLRTTGKTYSELMELLRTAWGEKLVAADLWLHHLEQTLAQRERMAMAHHRPLAAIVTDVETATEAAWVRNRAGTLLRVLPLDGPAVAPAPGERQLVDDGCAANLRDRLAQAVDNIISEWADGMPAPAPAARRAERRRDDLAEAAL